VTPSDPEPEPEPQPQQALRIQGKRPRPGCDLVCKFCGRFGVALFLPQRAVPLQSGLGLPRKRARAKNCSAGSHGSYRLRGRFASAAPAGGPPRALLGADRCAVR
jgi:hypothetical protein